MAQWFQFCTNNWVWKSYRQDGCHICSLWTINTDSHVLGTDGQIQQIPLRITFPSSIFTRFSLLRLFPVSKPEEMIRRKKIHHQRAAHRRNRNLFWRVGQIILFGRLEKVRESLNQCTELKGDVEKKKLINKTVFYYVFLKMYWLAY